MNLGLNRYKVRVVESQTYWEAEYEKFAVEFRSVTSDFDLKMEHVGSTSVPGLAAKPIIDVAIMLLNAADFTSFEASLASIGLEYRGDKGTQGGRLFVRETQPEVRTHHVHVYFHGAPEWDRYLIFRDMLRSSFALRDEYALLKRRLARVYEDDRFAYTAGKSDFVRKTLETPPE